MKYASGPKVLTAAAARQRPFGPRIRLAGRTSTAGLTGPTGTGPAVTVQAGTLAEIMEADAALGACVTRLPPGTGPAGLAAALAEMSRVTRSGGAVVLLAPAVPRPAWPPALRLRRQVPVQLAAGRETIWVYRRA